MKASHIDHVINTVEAFKKWFLYSSEWETCYLKVLYLGNEGTLKFTFIIDMCNLIWLRKGLKV